MGAGRPTSYSNEMVTDAWMYVKEFANDQFIDNKLKVRLPTIEGLALYLEISRSTLYLWQKEHEEFSDIIEILLQKQAEALVNNGLSGNYNSTIAKVLLAKHGYKDEVKQEQSGGLTIKFENPGDYIYPSQDQGDSGIPESL